jgi:hypothetical protein
MSISSISLSMTFGFARSSRLILGIGALLLGAASAQAQIFYEPVQAQYAAPCGQPPHFYYGGSDPRILEFAARADCLYAQPLSTRGSQLRDSGMQRIPVSPRPRVYSDILPYRDMSDYGWRPSDAINEANARQPLYYRRADSPPPGTPGVWIVPSNGEGAVQLEPPPASATATHGAAATGVILIIPKRLLKPANNRADKADKIVAAAR